MCRGGAIELGIFAEVFKTEIVAFDRKALMETAFGVAVCLRLPHLLCAV